MERKLNDSVISKLLWLAAIGDEAEAMRYAAHVLPHGSDLAEVRGQMEDRIGSRFAFEVCDAIPWLNGEVFDNPLRKPASATPATTPGTKDGKPLATRDAILAFLALHKHRGLTPAQARARFAGDPGAILDGLAGEQAIAWVAEGTGGRPVKRYVALGGLGQRWMRGQLVNNPDHWDSPDMIAHYFGRIESGDPVPDHVEPILERERESQRTYGE